LIKIILEENLKWHLEDFASELFIYIYIHTHVLCKHKLLFWMRLRKGGKKGVEVEKHK